MIEETKYPSLNYCNFRGNFAVSLALNHSAPPVSLEIIHSVFFSDSSSFKIIFSFSI